MNTAKKVVNGGFSVAEVDSSASRTLEVGQASIESAKRFVEFIHGDNRAFVALFQKRGSERPRQYFHNGNKLADHVHEWIPDEDVYVSLNTFSFNRREQSAPERTAERVLRLNALYTDLDFYKLGISKEEALARIDEMIANEEVPPPSVIVHSGRGLQLIWLLEYMTVTPGYLRLWQRMQQAIFEMFLPLNADNAAKSVAQIYRVPGGTNSKNGVTVTAEYLRHSRYPINELKEWLLEELPADWKEQRKERLQKRTESRLTAPYKPAEGKRKATRYTAYKALKTDVEMLVNMRGGYVNRRRLMFYYAVFAMEVLQDASKLEIAVEELNDRLYKPLPSSFLRGVVQSGVRSYELARDDTAKAAAKRMGWQAGYTFTNAYLIENLEMTLEEQRSMAFIISEEEKQRRNTEYQQKKRRAAGMKTALEYNEKRADKKAEHMEKLRQLLRDNPKAKRKELAEALGVSAEYVKKLKQLLRAQEKQG